MLFSLIVKKCKLFPLHELLPLECVQTGPPVNLCADLTSSSPKNANTSFEASALLLLSIEVGLERER